MVYFRIECQDSAGRWDAGMVNEPNRFDTEDEARRALAALRRAGFADVPMRVVAINPIEVQ